MRSSSIQRTCLTSFSHDFPLPVYLRAISITSSPRYEFFGHFKRRETIYRIHFWPSFRIAEGVPKPFRRKRRFTRREVVELSQLLLPWEATANPSGNFFIPFPTKNRITSQSPNNDSVATGTRAKLTKVACPSELETQFSADPTAPQLGRMETDENNERFLEGLVRAASRFEPMGVHGSGISPTFSSDFRESSLVHNTASSISTVGKRSVSRRQSKAPLRADETMLLGHPAPGFDWMGGVMSTPVACRRRLSRQPDHQHSAGRVVIGELDMRQQLNNLAMEDTDCCEKNQSEPSTATLQGQ
ncbi:hypothetical protein EDB80DRAFT_693605 [Ilyonectria destructans]|nr:hypothetical protein EDB80DRAFT_693605 [Ilyonectria destructans]